MATVPNYLPEFTEGMLERLKRTKQDFYERIYGNGFKVETLGVEKLALGRITITKFKNEIKYLEYKKLKAVKQLLEERRSPKRKAHFKHRLELIEEEIQSRVFSRLKGNGPDVSF